MDITEFTSKFCQNCKSPLEGDFCGVCGQQNKEVRRPFLKLLQELLHLIFELDGRAYRTVYYLFTRPAFLAKEYVEGRRARYTPPLRLFLILSIALYLAVAITTTIRSIDSSLSGDLTTSPDTLDISLGDEDLDDLSDDLEEVSAVLEELTLPFLRDDTNTRLRLFLNNQIETNYRRIREDPEGFVFGSLEYVSLFMLMMMPMLAVIQKLLYFRSGKYYIEHLVLTLHNHTFLALALMVGIPLQAFEQSSMPILSTTAGLLDMALEIWMVIYLFLSLRVFFSQGYLITALKFITATVIYSVLLSVGIAIFMAIYFILF